MNKTIVILYVFVSVSYVWADSVARPRPRLYSSPSGSHYFRMHPGPDIDWNQAEAWGEMYEVAEPKGKLLWKTKR